MVGEFQASPLGELMAMARSPAEISVAATIREIYWEIHCYQPFTTRAGFALIGAAQPEDRKVMRILLLHKWEEVEHRVWALDGYKALRGGRERTARRLSLLLQGRTR